MKVRRADVRIDKLAKKYRGVGKYQSRRPGEERILLRIKPEKVFYMKAR